MTMYVPHVRPTVPTSTVYQYVEAKDQESHTEAAAAIRESGLTEYTAENALKTVKFAYPMISVPCLSAQCARPVFCLHVKQIIV